MEQIHKQLKEQDVDVLTEVRSDGETTAYFYDDVLIAIKRDRDISIFKTFEQKVSELLNVLLSKTTFEHYINQGVNYITFIDERGKVQRRPLDKEFTWRVEL